MLSAFEPPSDLADLEAWLLEREEEIAKVVIARLTAIIDEASTAFTATLTASGDMSAFDSIPIEWSQFVREDLGDRLGGMYLSGGISAWIQSPNTDALPKATAQGWTDVVNTNAVSYAADATNRLTGPIADSIWNDLRLKMSKAIETGMSTEKLAEEIALNRDFAAYRAQAIARTEVNGAYNAGNYQSNQALGDVGPVEKYWLATGDDRTRPTHREANGQVRAFNDPFIVGGSEMLYPHDPSGPAKEVVNCRCVTAFLYPGMARPDGTIVPEAQPLMSPPSIPPARQATDITQDLIQDDRARTIGQAGTRWDGSSGVDLSNYNDPMLEYIADRQGFSALPEVLDSASFERRLADGNYQQLWRGVSEAQYADQFKRGSYFGGQGVYGSGTYTTTARDRAVLYAKKQDENLLRLGIKKDARIIDYMDAAKQMDKDLADVPEELKDALSDEGRWAASKGYDAIRRVRDNGEEYWIVLNRSALIVEA